MNYKLSFFLLLIVLCSSCFQSEKGKIKTHFKQVSTYYVHEEIALEVHKTKDNIYKEFSLNYRGHTVNGVAKLILHDDNGRLYIPEGTAIPDENDNTIYECDSTFNYISDSIKIVFALEKGTQKKLSLITIKSKIKSIENGFYTLYKTSN